MKEQIKALEVSRKHLLDNFDRIISVGDLKVADKIIANANAVSKNASETYKFLNAENKNSKALGVIKRKEK